MLAELDEDERAQTLSGQARRQQGDRSGDCALGTETAQATRDRRGRKGYLLRKSVRGLAVVALDQVQKRNVEAIKHLPKLPNFGTKGSEIARNTRASSLTVLVE